MRHIASGLNKLSHGHLTPNTVTIAGVILHLPIACCIAAGWWWQAAVLLIILGLFDTLDGELARLTKRVSAVGMVLDASTDRLKETFLYTGAVYYFAIHDCALGAAIAALAMGTSICVSYVKARGEIAVATNSHKKYSHEVLNKKLFPSGLLPFEIRMSLLILGLLVGGIWWSNALFAAIAIIAIGSLFTFIQRLINIARFL
jgi:phosphatidylglycerophosphate synthase